MPIVYAAGFRSSADTGWFRLLGQGLKYFFDTNCIRGYPKDLIERVLADTRGFPRRYASSSITAIELLSKMGEDAVSNFPMYRNRLRFFLQIGSKDYLPFPEYFIAKKVFGVESKFAQVQGERIAFEFLVQVSKDDTFVHERLTNIHKIVDDLEQKYIRDSERQLAEAGKHFGALTATIAGKVAVLESTARSCGVPLPLRASCYTGPDKYLQKLDAYYRFRTTILDRHGYDFAKHRNDILDSYQLTYLAEKKLCLVTDDRGIHDKIKESPQANRVIRTEAFLRIIGSSPTPLI